MGLKIVFGTAGFNPGANFPDVSSITEVLDILEKHNVQTLDTAQLYGESESLLGKASAGTRFTIDTKAKGGFDPGSSLKPENLYRLAHESLSKLNVKQVDIFYIHAPDDSLSPETWIPTIDKLHKEGVFKRLGLSNFSAADVQKVYDVAKAHNAVLPSAYQGNYSAVTRRQETELIPTLRELGLAFYAYSPIAGGFLAKTRQILEGEGDGRFTNNDSPLAKMYRGMYLKPAYLDALDHWNAAAEEQGVSKAELAYRWVNYHSALKAEHGDAIIFGARNIEQTVQTLEGLEKGPLKESVVKKIDEIWGFIKDEAPLDNFNSHFKGSA